MLRSRLLIFGAVCSLLAACSSFNPYKIDVQQGNVLTQEMVLTDIFHQQRWEYVYSYRKGRTGEVETRQFSVYFDKDNRLERVSGDVAVGDPDELVAPTARTRVVDYGTLPSDGSAPPMPPPEGPGFIEGLIKSVGF